jgi:hypothetical protein
MNLRAAYNEQADSRDNILLTMLVVLVAMLVGVCVSRSDDRVTWILTNSVCWWNHPLGRPQLVELAVVGPVPPFVCVCVLVVCVLPCP